MEISFRWSLLTLIVPLFQLISSSRITESPVKIQLVYYELQGKDAMGASYKFKMNPIHTPPPCEDIRNGKNTCNLVFEFSRCNDEVSNATCTASTHITGIEKTAFFTCETKVKRYLNGLKKPINGSHEECLKTELGGQGKVIQVKVFNNHVQIANTTVPLGRGRSIAQEDIKEKTMGRTVKFLLYQDDTDEFYRSVPST